VLRVYFENGLDFVKETFMRIAIFGTGGVGGYFGGRLAQAGEEVIFIARGQHLQALHTHGLRVDSPKGDFVIEPVQATDAPGEVGVVDVVLLGVKAWQVPEAAQAIRPLIGPETIVLPLQNGVEAPTQLAEVLGAEHIIGGLCRIISFVAGPGHIRHAGADPFIQFGELANRRSDRVEKLRQAFARTTGITAEISPDIQVAMWQKFLLIVGWSGMGAITRAPVGTYLSLPQTRQMLQGVMEEVWHVARAHNIVLPEDMVDKTLTFMDGLPPDGTASMQRDIMEGRPSELESQNGAVVRLGQAVGLETPLNAFIYNCLLPL
jgi:2-dehydropantoate 2-reductase